MQAVVDRASTVSGIIEKATRVTEQHLASGLSAVSLLADASGLSRARVKDAMTKGAVWRRAAAGRPRRLRRATARLKAGDELSIYYNPGVLAQAPGQARLVEDCGAFSVWDKPPGMLCQGSKWGDHCTLARFAEQSLPPRKSFVVHRLDRMASGLVVLAHNKGAARGLSAQFASREVCKRYRCLVQGMVHLDGAWLLDTPLEGKEARTWVEQATPLAVDDTGQPRSELVLRIETGRKHQIRQHLALAGMPILGDEIYGTGREEVAGSVGQGQAGGKLTLQLRAIELSLNDPVSGLVKSWKLH